MKYLVATNLLLVRAVLCDLPAVTITTAPASVQSALASYISNWDHHTLGVNATVGGIIASIYAASAANPDAANAILDVRSHLNFMQGPTPLFKDLETPSSVIATISAQLPATAPFPQALDLVSSIYGYLGSVASSELKGQTTITAPAGWTLAPMTETDAVPMPQATSAPAVSDCSARKASSSNSAAMVSSTRIAVSAAAVSTPATNAGVRLSGSLAVVGSFLGVGLWFTI